MIVREPGTWVGVLLSLRGSVVKKIWLQLAGATSIAVVVAIVWESLPDHHKTIKLTVLPFTLIGLALAIFLGFRNNASYDRHWEGRKLWGQLVNTCRSFARQILCLVDAGKDDPALAAFHKEMLYRVMAYPHALRCHLRSQDPLPGLAPFLAREEIDRLAVEKNVPIAILATLGERLRWARREGWVHDLHVPLLEQSLIELTNVQGGCERILNSPLPFAYTLLIHRIAGFYCFALPFGIVDQVEWMTPVVVLFVSYAFFGLDAIGDEIEDPFGTDPNDLPLAALSRTIEINLRQRLGEKDLPPAHEPVNGILD
ncbi:MAG: hypothetical protein HY720_06700 [Planctomycetes bacterium]|nr:hypothetical protein [Planctomycetota bacterium]